MAKAVIRMNSEQYNQAHHTPFGSCPLAKLLGRNANTAAAQMLLQGILPSIPHNTLPEVNQMLSLIALSSLIPMPPSQTFITGEEFISAYKVTKENTSSSPSSHHVGHYKAAISNPAITMIHCTMISLPFAHGFTPARWEKVVDIMLPKDVGNVRCHHLHIIALFDNDLNQAK